MVQNPAREFQEVSLDYVKQIANSEGFRYPN